MCCSELVSKFMYRKYREEHKLKDAVIMSSTGGCEKKAAELIKASLCGGQAKNVPHVFVVLGASVSLLFAF